MYKIIIIEDDDNLHTIYKKLFRQECNVQIADILDNGENALSAIERIDPELMIIDISLPGISGIELVKQIKETYPRIKVLIVTGYEPDVYYESARKAGADGYITKDNPYEIKATALRLLFQD